MNIRQNRPWQRLLALMLCAEMLASFLPVTARAEETAAQAPVQAAQTAAEEAGSAGETAAEPQAETETDGGTLYQETGTEYVSLPVTIRDFAADGMLFEFNQVNMYSTQYAPLLVYDYI